MSEFFDLYESIQEKKTVNCAQCDGSGKKGSGSCKTCHGTGKVKHYGFPSDSDYKELSKIAKDSRKSDPYHQGNK